LKNQEQNDQRNGDQRDKGGDSTPNAEFTELLARRAHLVPPVLSRAGGQSIAGERCRAKEVEGSNEPD